MTTVDIILVCYNQEQYIEQTMHSIYAQELPKGVSARIIVADDASLDNTLAIIKRLASKSPFPIVFLPEEPNMGISKNYKRSFEVAKADYVAILEGDDYWLPNHLAQHIRFLRWHRRHAMSANLFQVLKEPEGLQQVSWPYIVPYISITLQQQIECGNQLGNLSACVFRKSVLDKIPPRFYELAIADWELGMFVSQFGPLGLLKEVSSVYRIKSSGQWVRLNDAERADARISTIDAMDEYFEKQYHDSFLIVRNRVEKRERFSYTKLPLVTECLVSVKNGLKSIKHIFRR